MKSKKQGNKVSASKLKKKRRRFPVLIKKRRRDNHCLNCGAEFDQSSNYCPLCGQENNHNKASFATLIVDFFHNYFSFDSKFSNSLLPFFFDPGYLTKKFIEGKRVSFVNPIRLYLIISLVFFFVFSMVSSDIVEDSIKSFDEAKEELSDSDKEMLEKVMAGELSELESDSIYILTPNKNDSTDRTLNITIQKPDSTDKFLTEKNIQIYMRNRQDYNIPVDQLMDSLSTSSLSNFQLSLVKKLIRLDRAEGQVVISQLLKNLPLMMLFVLPICALLLKLFYIRRNQYYITHLVHSLHLHSFAYIIYGFAFVLVMYWLPEGADGFWIIFLSFVLVCTHSYLSFLRVYGQRWFKTFVKFNLIGFTYSIILMFAVFIELLLSVFTY